MFSVSFAQFLLRSEKHHTFIKNLKICTKNSTCAEGQGFTQKYFLTNFLTKICPLIYVECLLITIHVDEGVTENNSCFLPIMSKHECSFSSSKPYKLRTENAHSL